MALLTSVAWGCDSTSSTPSPAGELSSPAGETNGLSATKSSYVLAPFAYRLSPQIVAQLELEPEQVRVPRGAPAVVSSRERGDVLVADTGPTRFWRYITAVESNGGQVVYQTRQAELTEVVQEGEFLFESAVRESAAQNDAARNDAVDGDSTRTRQQELSADFEHHDDFRISKDLGTSQHFQFADNQVDISTSGTLDFRPGYKLYIRIENLSIAELEFSAFGRLDIDGAWQAKVNEGQQAAPIQAGQIVREVPLCTSGSSCRDGRPTLEFDVVGQTYRIYPKLTLGMSWAGGGSGTVTGGFGGSGYVKAGYRYAMGDGEFLSEDDFNAQATRPDSSGEVELELRTKLEMSMVGEGGGAKIIEAVPLAANFGMQAYFAPPTCEFRSKLRLRGEVKRYGLLGSGSWPLYDATPFDLYHDVSDIGGVDCSADNSGEATSCSQDSQCDNAEICSAAGYCVANTPMQISLMWDEPVDLDLEVEDADGLRLAAGSPAGTSNTNDRSSEGWMAVWSCGGCEEETPQAGSFGEVALFERVRYGRKYILRVKNKTQGQDPQKLVRYQLNIFDRSGDLDEIITGKLQAKEGATSVAYQYQPREPQVD